MLADALVSGDVKASVSTYLSLDSQGERLPSLSYQIASRLREALAVALRLQNGEPPKEIARSLRMPARAAERFVADVRKADAERLSGGLARLSDVEVDLRGGAQVSVGRRPEASLSEQTVAVLTIQAIAGEGA
jgi:DNA polymerase-3 subunit delta